MIIANSGTLAMEKLRCDGRIFAAVAQYTSRVRRRVGIAVQGTSARLAKL
jgi:hypothetical protein